MKKIFLTLLLLVFATGFSQKKLIIYNFSSVTVKIYGIKTKSDIGTFPTCSGFSFALLSGQGYTLENNLSITKFPFYTYPISVPEIISAPGSLNWTRYGAIGTATTLTGVTMWNSTYAASQSFNNLIFGLGSTSAPQGGPIGPSNPTTQTNAIGHWQVRYVRNTISPTNYEDYIFFEDF